MSRNIFARLFLKNMKNKNIAIIGAGLSGVVLARKLAENNDVTIFEKARGVGGRMATRRAGDFNFDHGTQYFTAKTPQFQEFCKQMQSDGIIELWNPKFAEIDGTKTTRTYLFNETIPHFVATPHMNSICKHFAKNLNVAVEAKIEKISFQNEKWLLEDANAKEYSNFDLLILAIPSHQVMELLPQNFAHYQEIANIKMQGCFTLMLGFNKEIPMDFEAGIIKNSILSWVASNGSKPQRAGQFALVVHSSNNWAEENIEGDQEKIKAQMMEEVKKIVPFENTDIEYSAMHRWRYANSPKRNAEKSYFDPNLNLGICGDYLIGGRVENAFLSGTDLVERMTNF